MQRRTLIQSGLSMALLVGLSACGGGGGTESVPGSGSSTFYQAAQYRTTDLAASIDVAYSTRPNMGGVQSQSERTQASDVGQSTLTLRMDVWVPPNATASAPQPLVVWIHGGGFFQGSKEDVRDKALSYAQAGYVVASVNYRLTPNNDANAELRLTAQTQAAEDVANAIRYLKSNAARYHIDTSRVATVGVSAGGALSLANAVDADTLEGTVSDFPGVSAKVQAAVSTGATLVDIYNSIDQFSFDATDAPVLLLHADPTDSLTGATWTANVLPTQARINASGNSCTLVSQPNQTHTVDLSLTGSYWAGSVYPFLRSRLNLAALGAP